MSTLESDAQQFKQPNRRKHPFVKKPLVFTEENESGFNGFTAQQDFPHPYEDIKYSFEENDFKRPPMDIDYKGKLILAPMVRVSCLPFNLMSLNYGADIVYNAEIIDKKIVQCERSYNPVLDCIEWRKGRELVFQSHPSCKPLVFQMGTSDATLALRAAEKIMDDIDAIDINMGCPKKFSVHSGMGAALLTNPDVAEDILTTLVRNTPKPVTCKIRINEDLSQTIEFCKRMAGTGISALAIHTRTRDERPRQPAHWDTLAKIAAEMPSDLPLIANGDAFTRDDIDKLMNDCGIHSVMLARGAMWNASLFHQEGPFHPKQVMKEYLRYSIRYGEPFAGTKYTIHRMMDLPSVRNVMEGRDVKVLQQTKSVHAIGEWIGEGTEEMVEQWVKEVDDRTKEYLGATGKEKVGIPLEIPGENSIKRNRQDGEQDDKEDQEQNDDQDTKKAKVDDGDGDKE